MNREKSLLKNILILAFGTVLPKLVTLITLPIITGCLTKEEYGTYDLVITGVSLFLPIATLQMQAAAFRFLIEVRDDEAKKIEWISNILIFVTITSMMVLIILYMVLYKFETEMRVLVVIYYFLDIIVVTLRQIARGLSFNTVYSASVLINSFSELALVAFFMLGFKRGLDGALLALSLSLFFSAVFITVSIHLPRYIRIKAFSKEAIKELMGYSWPMIPNSLSSWVMSLSDRLVLSAFLGVTANAIYAVANKLPNLFGIVQSTFSLAWQENACVYVDDEDSSVYYGKMFSVVYRGLVGIMALLIGGTPILFKLLIRGDYSKAYIQMPILFIAALFSSVSSYLGGIYIAHKKSKEIGITTTCAAMVNVLIDLLLVKKIGIYAASLSTVISYFVLVIYRMIDVQKIQKIKFDFLLVIRGILILGGMCVICAIHKTVTDILNLIVAIVVAICLNMGELKSIQKKLLARKYKSCS